MTTIKGYAVESQDEHDEVVFTSRDDAVEYMEKITGKKESEWSDYDADYVEDSDDMIFIKEVEVRLHD